MDQIYIREHFHPIRRPNLIERDDDAILQTKLEDIITLYPNIFLPLLFEKDLDE